ncbi:arf-GAP with Rho-GAP domain, ANK repeat and PH domain-containing protein 2 [Schistocerca cancellata]|uniref:arf-GAP with Rho-GAP domain, ANK repeat and PH domain-containing protein 2 n=1 Tax=Schistocerca cancellata TaxID=274614 RepID=UPI002119262C|nr:arf-GAP with Rho-GAP domain, ANK repeat and PH domain-containing protein 2 [Schistocerca cancellata]
MDIPIPKPRRNPQLKPSQDEAPKKPVPLPRHRQGKGSDCDSSETDNVTADRSMKHLDRSPSKQPSSRSIRKEIEAASEAVREKGRTAFGNTKNASLKLEKSFRSIGKRLTVHSLGKNTDVGVEEPKVERSHSLPAENIFQSISFKSPLVADDSAETLVNLCEPNDDDFQSFNAPPPIYPPPPLPDESVYDEVQSVLSHSSLADEECIRCSSAASCPDSASVYEEVSISNRRIVTAKSMLGNNDVQAALRKLSISDTLPSSGSSKCSEMAHDSKSRHDIASIFDESLVSGRNSVSNSSISPSLLSELDLSEYNTSPEEIFEDDRYSCSMQSNVSSAFSVQNELYDKWEPDLLSKPPGDLFRKKGETRRAGLPANSVIYEFDPLFKSTPESKNATDIEFQSLLLGDATAVATDSPYGKISRVIYSTIPEAPKECPPIPPRRSDSVTVNPKVTGSIVIDDSVIQQDYQNISRNVPASIETVLIVDQAPEERSVDDSVSQVVSTPVKSRKSLVRWSSMKNAMKFVSDSSWSPTLTRRNNKLEKTKKQEASLFYETDSQVDLEPPLVKPQMSKLHSGLLYRLNSKKSNDYVERWCSLAEGKLSTYMDKSMIVVKDVIQLASVMSIHVVLDHKISCDGDCFEITLVKGQSNTFGTSGSAERRIWMQKILESITSVFPTRITAEYTRAGWCFLKEGINGIWHTGWILITERTLLYCITNGAVQEADLRKARYVVLQPVEKDSIVPQVLENGPLVVADFHTGLALYLRLNIQSEAAAWQKAIHRAAVNNGLHLHEQQLTRDDVPVIVDKCINFVYAHGSLSEGIYRHAGKNSNVTRLLALFRKDAWHVHLAKTDFSEYEVATVLKRFFRELPECLFTAELHDHLCEIAAGKYGRERTTWYSRVLEKLPPINYVTARKLVGHLYFIHEQCEKNRMPVDNLAAIWGPTLMHVESDDTLDASQAEVSVVADLIRHYPELFRVDNEELQREKRMLEILERYHHSNNNMSVKQTGEFKVWIHLEAKDSGNCVSVTIGPQKSAGDICMELASKMNWPGHRLVLEEVICNGELTRPLHYTEKVLDTVLRWGYWDDADRKDNCLVLCRNTVLEEVAPLAKPPLSMCGELKFADRKNKSFKNFLFEFSQAKLCYYRDKDGSIKINEWKIEDIVWYVGHESKRNPHMRWAITFVEKNGKRNRSKETPYFGYTIAGSSREEQLRWMAAMLIGEYPQGILPSPMLLE